MESTKLVTKPSFKLDLGRINSKFGNGFNNSNIREVNDNNKNFISVHDNSEGNDGMTCDNIQIMEQLKRIEEENIRLREINEQLSRSLSMSTRSISMSSSYNSFQQINDVCRQPSFLDYQPSLTSRSISMSPYLAKNLKATVSDIIGDRQEIALSVTLLEDVYFLGLEPIYDRQSARVVLSKTPSYWSIKKIPHFWEGFSNIVSSVMKKGFLNTLSYWSFLRAPPSPKKNVKRWEGITIKYKGPLKEFRGYSLAGNDDGLFVYLQSDEDAYDNIFYCNFRRKREKHFDNGNGTDTRKNILNLLHANTRSYICIEPNIKCKEGTIMIKLSESKKNKLMFEEISATELLSRQLLVSAEQISKEFDQANRNIIQTSSFQTFRYDEQNVQKINLSKYSLEESFTSRTVELCRSAETQNRVRRGSLADELSNELSTNGNQSLFGNFFGDIGNLKYHPNTDVMDFNEDTTQIESRKITEQRVTENSKICSPRIRASNIINDQVSGLEYHEVPLTRRLNVVYIPSTTAVLVHDLVDSEEELNNNGISEEKISDAEQEYFKVE